MAKASGQGAGEAIRIQFQSTGEASPDCISIETAEVFERGRWPEARIIRPINLDAPEAEELGGLVNFLGRNNYGKGTGHSVGSLAVSYVTATEMGKMLSEKFPKVYGSRRKTIQLQRRLSKNYQQFVQSGSAIDNAFAGMPQVCVDFDAFENDSPTEEPVSPQLEVDECRWVGASFGVQGFAKYARNGLGLDLSTNEELLQEMAATREFLQSEKLNTRYIDPNREPHVVVFTSFDRLGSTTLTAIHPPTMVALDSPRMWVNSNEPSS